MIAMRRGDYANAPEKFMTQLKQQMPEVYKAELARRRSFLTANNASPPIQPGKARRLRPPGT